ncbi:hypothetical protein LBMAG53_27320 [Planctomycetota bacterium]|nr:hypothetical protein LBMAG53_27320 [Planctomycetota bacterium]
MSASRWLAFAVAADAPLRLTMCGIRAPLQPFAQPRRSMPDFIAFLVIRGEIRLTDEMSDGHESVVVGPGEIHVVAPGIWQASTTPFPSGMVFLWFHFAMGGYDLLTAEEVDAEVRSQHRSGQGTPAAARRWLIPRQFQLGGDLDAMSKAHTELLEHARLWGIDDRGTQVIGAAMVHRLHRAFCASRLHGREITRLEPGVAHVARAQAWIRLHHERPIALATIAQAISLNPAYLSRCFRRITGQTVGEALLAARIETAKRLLLDGASCKETARLAGFASSSYFCRMFQREVGTSPTRYLVLRRRR